MNGTVEYPTWTGPDGLANPLNNGQQLNDQNFTWASNKRDLNVSFVRLSYKGDFTCSYGLKNATISLNVLYFSGTLTQYSHDSIRDNKLEMRCDVYSNPNSTVRWTIMSVFEGRSTISPTVCRLQDQNFNETVRNKCTTIYTVTPVYKEDNGRRMYCNYEYPNKTENTDFVLDLYFPPSRVNLTDETLPINTTGLKELTCSTDSSNPVSELKWYKGKDSNIWQNKIISAKPSNVKNDLYNGKNISAVLELDVDNSMHGERIYCCAVHRNQQDNDLCVSRLISLFTSSSSRSSSSAYLMCLCLLLRKLVWQWRLHI